MNVATRIVRDLLVGFAALLALAPPVDGQTGYGYNSLEWMVAKSDVIVVASIAEVKRELLDPRRVNGGQRLTVRLEVSETLKGQPPHPLQLVFNTDYGQGRDIATMQSSLGTQLWFLVKNPDQGKNESDEQKLSFPGADTRYPLSPFPATGWESITLGPFQPRPNNNTSASPPWFRMNLDVLESPDEILRAVREELRASSGKSPQRADIRLPGELVAWIGQFGSGLDGLNIPLDARAEQIAREWIEHPDRVLAERGEGYYKREAEKKTEGLWQDRLSIATTAEERAKVEDDRRRDQESTRGTLRRYGIRALANFKSEENIKLLKALLADEATVRSFHGGTTFTELYLTRREAYTVLKEWAVNVPEPVTEKKSVR